MTEAERQREDKWAFDLLVCRVKAMTKEQKIAWAKDQKEEVKQSVREALKNG